MECNGDKMLMMIIKTVTKKNKNQSTQIFIPCKSNGLIDFLPGNKFEDELV